MNERLCGTQHSREGLSGLQFRPAAGKPEALPTDPNRLDDGLVMLLDEGHRYDGQFVGPEGHRYEHLGGDGRLGWIPERA